MFKNLLLSIITIFFIIGCSSKTPPIKERAKESFYAKRISQINESDIEDLKKIPQNSHFYATTVPDDLILSDEQKSLDKRFNRLHFAPWDLKSLKYKKSEAMWPFAVYSKYSVYGENYIKLPKNWFNRQRKNANFENYNTLNIRAITVRNSDLKNFPTTKPLFKNTKQAGEGFPFDYNQNSAIKANSPILISHYSKDRAFVFVQSSFALGWVKVEDIALVNEEFISKFKNGNYSVIVKDRVPIYDGIGNFKFYAKVGTIFPILKARADSFEVGIVLRDIDSKAVFSKSYISRKFLAKKPIEFNSINLAEVTNELLNEPYGWGGVLQNRDCSATMKDFFSPFGLWLPRNSAAQAKSGTYISLQGLSNRKKEELILQKAIPFMTLIYLKGHIMLYIGEYEGRALVFHNSWGVKTVEDGVEKRHIIGRAAITTLEPGRELDGFSSYRSILSRVRGITILAPTDMLSKL